MTPKPWSSITVGDIAKRSAATWLHGFPEHEALMHRPFADWPNPTYLLAIHIQEAITEAVHVAAGNGEGI